MKSINKEKYPREYRIWKALRARCYAHCYKNSIYQQKGIKVNKEWDSFDNFINEMGKCPDNYSIDRIDNDGDYTFLNCRWANSNTQAKNRGNFNKVYTYKGDTLCLKDWSKKLGIKYTTLYLRLTRGQMSFLKAIEYTPKTLFEGKYYEAKELCKLYNQNIALYYDRIHRGWSTQDALLTPKLSNNKKSKRYSLDNYESN